MDHPNIATIDLNLLRVFDSIYREGNILRAAERLGMSQPAASHALARLRHALKDDLFVRSARGMLPTARAEQLAGPVRQALSCLELGLQSGPFDPTTATQRFTIALDNASAVSLSAPILAAVSAAAPLLRLDLRPSGTLDIDRMIDEADLDLFIGKARPQLERFASEELFSDDFAVLHRTREAPETLTPEALTALPHLHLSSAGDDTEFVDRWLGERGARREVRHSVPLLGCEAVLERQDFYIVMRRRMALALCNRTGLSVSDLPFPSPRIVTCLRWHRRLDAQPAHQWLRRTIRSVCTSNQSTNTAAETACKIIV
ncbi:LysR family transcriptional regulator [Azospirillum sp. B506]|uniref:LysR family transcriptional regulator n=1 Tax=Azospirillum sp. B506 TaxID=137721 RepID=UPI000348ADA3|nr:LysR family transcriptional regulator [Azospirillum sp. B506]